MKTIIEPFRIKAVERLRFSTREERERILRDAAYNVGRKRKHRRRLSAPNPQTFEASRTWPQSAKGAQL